MVGWLAISWALAFGVVPQQDNVVNKSEQSIGVEQHATYSAVKFKATAWDTLSLYTSIENYQYAATAVSYKPYRVDYTAGASIRVNKNINIVIEHTCVHPVLSSGQDRSSTLFSQNSTKAYIELHGEGSL